MEPVATTFVVELAARPVQWTVIVVVFYPARLVNRSNNVQNAARLAVKHVTVIVSHAITARNYFVLSACMTVVETLVETVQGLYAGGATTMNETVLSSSARDVRPIIVEDAAMLLSVACVIAQCAIAVPSSTSWTAVVC